MRLIEALSIDAIELAHACGEVAVGGFDEQVVVVTHLTVGVADPVEAFADVPQHIQPQIPIFLFEVDILPPVATLGDVVEGTGKLYAQRSAHAMSLPPGRHGTRPDPVLLTPFFPRAP